MPAALNTTRARQRLQAFEFRPLFIEELGWEPPASRKVASFTPPKSSAAFDITEIAQLAGFRVFEAIAQDGQLPDAAAQLAVSKHVSAASHEHILIFADAARTRSLWFWVRREQGGKKRIPRRHHYLRGQPGDLFLSKLAALFVDISELDENGQFSLTEAATRVQRALDVEAVTKQFFRDFQTEHLKLLDLIKGIPDPRERRWYASVLMNRLMFVWFLQAKGFLAGENRDYLPGLLTASQQAGKNRFFSHTLRDLFFEGFAKPSAKRQPVGTVPLADIPYLNGGLFLPHGIEQRIEGDSLLTAAYAKIKIPDEAFTEIFAIFRRYSWSLNDTPGGDDREINPDVLGYIFEKYINQKEFGAYYTRPEITEYLCEQTIHQLLLDRANAGHDTAAKLHLKNPKSFPAPRRYTGIDDLLFHADGPLCARLLHDVLPRLSLLDPACGSGAFLVAAQKTLLNLYTALLGRCEALNHKPVLDWIAREKQAHKAPAAYWLKKKIVTENLYGVDIMEEATEIAKLRLFLSLVASAEKRDQLEPLPNIEFNILAGNSLIGLLHVDASAFDGSNHQTGTSPNRTSPADSRRPADSFRGKSAGLPESAGTISGVSGSAQSSIVNHQSPGQQRFTLTHAPAADELGLTIESTTAPTRSEREAAHLATVRAAKYAELLAEKNRLIALYKKAPELIGTAAAKDSDSLVTLRRSIEQQKAAAREVLDKLLLDEFQRLGIQFHQATWDSAKKKDGRPEKRTLRLEDIRALQPFHWAYEFDDILITRGGFDAIITNPPWENFKPDDKEFFMPLAEDVSKNKMRLEDFIERKTDVLTGDSALREKYLAYLSRFPHVNLWFRNSEQYENQTAIVNGRKATTDLNLYKLFLEQTLHLLHTGGYCGIVIPGGIYSDLGATRLRQMLFEKTRITGLFGFENRKQIFENVDSRFKFVVLTFRPGDTTTKFPAAFMRHEVQELSTFPNEDSINTEIELVRKLSPDSLSLTEFRAPNEVALARKLLSFPLLGETIEGQWQLFLHREFHITDDAALYRPQPAKGLRPLVEGKSFHQFVYPFSEPRYWVDMSEARTALLPGRLRFIQSLAKEHKIKATVSPDAVKLDYQSYRLAFRDIAASTNERTMIASILPPNVVCPDTVRLDEVYFDSVQDGRLMLNQTHFSNHVRLCVVALFNSFIVDYLIRQKVTSHVSLFYVYQLPIPRLTAQDAAFRPLVERAARLVGTSAAFDDLLKEVFGPKATHRSHGVPDPATRQRLRAEMDALVARLYGLTEPEFTHILATFPLVNESVKTETLNTFRDLLKTGQLPS
ncbi:MAG TPA: hypothetical protein PK490_00290 [Prosthecobacter sp.]|nr:hypothetical protein [Prosthecobacter sp.]HRK12689.1 hypothetical protein [Prosthecobacter sp.]